MSNEVFPTLAGLKWATVKAPEFSTRVKRSVSGYEVRISDRIYPTYQIKLQFEFLRSNAAFQELQQIIGLFLRHKGSGDSFLLLDPDDSVANSQAFGAGTGVQTDYALVGAWAGFAQPVRHIKSISSMTAARVEVPYTLLSTGLVRFGSAPASGAVLRWSGEYYHRCRFADDSIGPRQLMEQIWELGQCDLVGALGAQLG